MTNDVITVGVDGSDSSTAALVFAVEEAVRRNATMRAVTVWEASALHTAGGIAQLEQQRHAEYDHIATTLQDEAIRAALEVSAGMPRIDRRIVQGDPGYALVELSRDSELLIIGTEHKGLLKRITAGSISSYCIRHSRVPVVVVPFVKDNA